MFLLVLSVCTCIYVYFFVLFLFVFSGFLFCFILVCFLNNEKEGMELEGGKDLGDNKVGETVIRIYWMKNYSQLKKKQLLSSHHYICNLEERNERGKVRQREGGEIGRNKEETSTGTRRVISLPFKDSGWCWHSPSIARMVAGLDTHGGTQGMMREAEVAGPGWKPSPRLQKPGHSVRREENMYGEPASSLGPGIWKMRSWALQNLKVHNCMRPQIWNQKN